MRALIATAVLLVLALGCKREVKLSDLSQVVANERGEAQQNWERTERAFKAEDARALDGLVGSKVLIFVEASGSPWTAKVLSIEEREASLQDVSRLAEVRGERAASIAREIRARRDKAWQLDCRIDFTKKQVRHHFIWPDAVFTANFELIGVLTEASTLERRIRIQPVAIQPMILQL